MSCKRSRNNNNKKKAVIKSTTLPADYDETYGRFFAVLIRNVDLCQYDCGSSFILPASGSGGFGFDDEEAKVVTWDLQPPKTRNPRTPTRNDRNVQSPTQRNAYLRMIQSPHCASLQIHSADLSLLFYLLLYRIVCVPYIM